MPSLSLSLNPTMVPHSTPYSSWLTCFEHKCLLLTTGSEHRWLLLMNGSTACKACWRRHFRGSKRSKPSLLSLTTHLDHGRPKLMLSDPCFAQLPHSPSSSAGIDAIETFIRRQRNPLLDRLDFYNLKQDVNEQFDAFLALLKELYKACDFDGKPVCIGCLDTLHRCSTCYDWIQRKEQEIMRDRIVVGIWDDETRHKLLSSSGLTLHDAIEICRAEEAAKTTQNVMGDAQGGHINAVRRTTYQKRKAQHITPAEPRGLKPTIPPPASHGASSKKCSKCGYMAHTSSACPAIGKTKSFQSGVPSH